MYSIPPKECYNVREKVDKFINHNLTSFGQRLIMLCIVHTIQHNFEIRRTKISACYVVLGILSRRPELIVPALSPPAVYIESTSLHPPL